MPNCEHRNLSASVDVNRIEDIGAFHADIRIACADCGEPFQFVGVPIGLSYDRPTVEFGGRELRAPIRPASEGVLGAIPTGVPRGYRVAWEQRDEVEDDGSGDPD